MIDIILLGTSALLPLPERALTSAALFCEGHSILFDCGEGTQTAARKCGVSLMKTDIIALTHYHGDHILGIPGLLQTMSCMGRTEKIYITGPEGLAKFMAPILTLTDFISFDVVLLESLPEKLCDLIRGWPSGAKLNAFPTSHRVQSQGYCFTLSRLGKFLPDKAQELNIPVNQWHVLQHGENIFLNERVITPSEVMQAPRKGLKFIFTGDTCECDEIINASKNADLLICEATYGEDFQAEQAREYGHMNFAQAAGIAKSAQVKRLWLSHYSQIIGNPLRYLPNAQKIFPEAICGHDGMKITLDFEE